MTNVYSLESGLLPLVFRHSLSSKLHFNFLLPFRIQLFCYLILSTIISIHISRGQTYFLREKDPECIRADLNYNLTCFENKMSSVIKILLIDPMVWYYALSGYEDLRYDAIGVSGWVL